MTKNSIEFGGSDVKALEYIRKRGYASYSSMCNVRDKRDPQPWVETTYYKFGKELHSRFLEHKKIEALTPPEEILLKAMIESLCDDVMVMRIMEGAKCEVEFDKKVNGLRTYGRIDIKNFCIGDLKTTRHTRRNQFIADMDFLQAALYTRVTSIKDFYYIGISKVPPHQVMVFNVRQFSGRFELAEQELDRLTKYIKKSL